MRWELHDPKYQKTFSDASAREEWRLVERIYKMDQKQEYKPEQGYVEIRI